jgi:hypothetical protein
LRGTGVNDNTGAPGVRNPPGVRSTVLPRTGTDLIQRTACSHSRGAVAMPIDRAGHDHRRQNMRD